MQNLANDAVTLSIEGMACAGCAQAVTNALSRVAGVTAVAVDLDSARARVEGSADPHTLIAAVTRAGFGAAV